MTTQPSPLAVGDTLPDSSVVDHEGAPSTLRAAIGTRGALVYYMRTPGCPVCNTHLRTIARLVRDKSIDGVPVVIVVPGGVREAAQVAKRHAGGRFTVRASETAHQDAGYFVKAGLQQSGTVVVTAAGDVTYAESATIPIKGFTAQSAVTAVHAL